MNKLIAAATVLCAMALVSGPARAADLMMAPVVPDTLSDASSFDWAGPYIGGTILDYPSAGEVGIGGEVGVNFLPAESFLLGIALEGEFFPTGTYSPEFWLKGRAGFVVDRLAVYGFGEVGNYVGGPGTYGLGAGVEFGVTDTVSIAGEIADTGSFGGPLNQVSAGGSVRFHF